VGVKGAREKHPTDQSRGDQEKEVEYYIQRRILKETLADRKRTSICPLIRKGKSAAGKGARWTSALLNYR